MKKDLFFKLSIVVCIFFAILVVFNIIFTCKIYSKVSDQTKQMENEREKEKLEEEKLKKEAQAKLENVENVTIGGSYTIKPTTNISDAYKANDTSLLTNEKDKETLKLASDILKKIIKKDMTSYQKELAVYEWMVKNVSFDSGSLVAIPTVASKGDTPYGVLNSKEAVCVGFATTFRLFMQMLDIECMVVHDDTLSHSWNLVKIENEWYNVDCTFDSSSPSQYYQNFNLNDASFSRTHTWDMTLFPAANGVKYSYAAQSCKELKDVFTLPKLLKEAIDKSEYRLYFSINMNTSVDVVNNMLESIQNRLSECYPTCVLYSLNENTYLLGIYIEYYDNVPASEDITEKEYEKIQTTVEKYFGSEINYDDYPGDSM